MYNLFGNSTPIMLQATNSAAKSGKYHPYSCRYVAHFIIIAYQSESDEICKGHFQSRHHKCIIAKQHEAGIIYFRHLLVILFLSSTYM